jgi:sulfate adenylyltransferase subunit 2
VDTTWKFREMYAFRDERVAEYGMQLLVHQPRAMTLRTSTERSVWPSR